MAKNFEHLIHKNSSVVTNGNPKLPTSSQLAYGELAINYAKDNETISLKNSDNEIVTFSSDKKIESTEKAIAMSLNDLNSRLATLREDFDESDEVAAETFNYLNGEIQGIGGDIDDLKDDIDEIDLAISSALTDLDERLRTLNYAGSTTVGGPASEACGLPIATVDSTSTSTVFTAQIPEFENELGYRDGMCFLLYNNVIASASGYTLDINGLGAKPVYTASNKATRSSTGFALNGTFPFWYDSTVNSGDGGWVYGTLADTNTDTIGYSLRTNGKKMPMSDAMRRYRLMFTSADGTKYVPATTSTSSNATSARTVCQTPINPFGEILYYASTTNVSAGSSPSATIIWQQYNSVTLGYSFNRTGAALTLTSWKPIYIKCAPQSDGSAIIDADVPFVQDLPTTEDGKIYIFLGIAISATTFELIFHHPVYYYKGGSIRLWTNQDALPTVTSSDNGKILMVVNGAWALVSPSTIYTGTGTPTSAQGNDGDIYLQTTT